jgi:hypothetical protein
MVVPLVGALVLRLLKAFNHLFFMLPVEEDDILRSRLVSEALSTLEAKSSFCKKTKSKRVCIEEGSQLQTFKS